MAKKLFFTCSLSLLIIFLTGMAVAQLPEKDDSTAAYEPNKSATTIQDKDIDLIYQFNIMEEIAPPVWRTTRKALDEARRLNADVIIIHLNTYGGMLESADSIRTALLQTPIPVWVFIDNNAASAGALISIACDSIYMRKGANIGAATVVDQEGKVVPDKYQSYMRSMMRSTAEATGRNADIAQAMVDPKIVVPGISDSTQVITFTSSEAMKYGFCEGEASSVQEILKNNGLADVKVVKQQLTALDKIISFLTKPFISGILIMLIIGGLYFELQSPGIGFALVVAVTAAALYFAPLYLEGLAANWEIIIFVVGLVLIALELFAIPGFGVAGITGIALTVIGLTLSLIGNIGFDFQGLSVNRIFESLAIVIIATFLSIILSFYTTSRLFGKKTIFGELALLSTQQTGSGYISADMRYAELVGKTGIAHTILRPAGKIEIDDDVYDAVAQTGYIDKDVPIRVIKYENAQLIVRKL
ncbi:MAG TPA: NfeD family protein [Lentimicrobium sp.]|nr:NfeD family protein [Lentimicrobium sp.]